jgi:DNA-binding NarL/FixJ family response regulator
VSTDPARREAATAQIRVVLADDHDVVRRGLAMVLESEPDFQVVGEVRNGQEAIDAAVRLRPDLVLLDVKMPVLDGVQAAKLIKHEAPEVRILMLTGITASPATLAMFQGAADGYILKDASPAELLDAVRTVAAGKPYLQGSIIRRLFGAVPLETEQSDEPIIATPLTPREIDILRLMATSHTNREIATQLFVSEETVRTHVKHILRKLAQPDRTQAVIAAVRAGLLDIG